MRRSPSLRQQRLHFSLTCDCISLWLPQEAAGREAAEMELGAIKEKYADELQLRRLAESGRQDIREEMEREKVARAAAEKALDTAMGKLAKEQHLNDVVQTAMHYIADRTPGVAEPQHAGDTSQACLPSFPWQPNLPLMTAQQPRWLPCSSLPVNMLAFEAW